MIIAMVKSCMYIGRADSGRPILLRAKSLVNSETGMVVYAHGESSVAVDQIGAAGSMNGEFATVGHVVPEAFMGWFR